jgi:hypothetical protein
MAKKLGGHVDQEVEVVAEPDNKQEEAQRQL